MKSASVPVLAWVVLVLSGAGSLAQDSYGYQPRYGSDTYSGSLNAPRYEAPSYASPSYGTSSGSSRQSSQPYYPPSESLLGPSYSYPQNPTLGDPRPYRNSDPRTCTGLLCD